MFAEDLGDNSGRENSAGNVIAVGRILDGVGKR
jgi:hypothetical protein